MPETEIKNSIHSLVKNFLNTEKFELQPITNSASSRVYFRVISNVKKIIVTYNQNVQENESFFYFSDLFLNNNVNVTKILSISEDRKTYIQEDLGSSSLLSVLSKMSENNAVKMLYKNAIEQLLKVQLLKEIDFNQCFDFKDFNAKLVYNDLMYFKFYFVQPLEFSFSVNKLLDEFKDIADKVESLSPKGFMYRDFQTRNIMIKDSETFLIDYQGGMKGPVIYDLISLLYQAKAQLSNTFKTDLKNFYFERIKKSIEISDEELNESYQYCLLVRLLQVLGSYGFRGIYQRKQHFIESIFMGLQNLKLLLKESTILHQYPELTKIVHELITEESEIKLRKLLNNE